MATKLQTALDEAIRKLTAMRRSHMGSNPCYCADNAQHMQDLRDLLRDTAEAVDLIAKTIAYEAGLGSMSNASKYAREFSGALEGNLDYELGQIIDGLAEDAPAPVNLQRELGTYRTINGKAA